MEPEPAKSEGGVSEPNGRNGPVGNVPFSIKSGFPNAEEPVRRVSQRCRSGCSTGEPSPATQVQMHDSQ